jgi:putative endonuclease
MERTFHVYLMASKSGVLYLGVTGTLANRVATHKDKLVPGFTRKYNVTRLVWFEPHSTARSAISREKEIKKWNRSKKIALIESLNPEWKDLAQTLWSVLNSGQPRPSFQTEQADAFSSPLTPPTTVISNVTTRRLFFPVGPRSPPSFRTEQPDAFSARPISCWAVGLRREKSLCRLRRMRGPLNDGGERWLLPLLARIDLTFPLLDIIEKLPPDQVDGEWMGYAAIRNPAVEVNKLIHFAMGVFWKASVHAWSGSSREPRIDLGPYREEVRGFLRGERVFPRHMGLVVGILPREKALISFNQP